MKSNPPTKRTKKKKTGVMNLLRLTDTSEEETGEYIKCI